MQGRRGASSPPRNRRRGNTIGSDPLRRVCHHENGTEGTGYFSGRSAAYTGNRGEWAVEDIAADLRARVVQHQRDARDALVLLDQRASHGVLPLDECRAMLSRLSVVHAHQAQAAAVAPMAHRAGKATYAAAWLGAGCWLLAVINKRCERLATLNARESAEVCLSLERSRSLQAHLRKICATHRNIAALTAGRRGDPPVRATTWLGVTKWLVHVLKHRQRRLWMRAERLHLIPLFAPGFVEECMLHSVDYLASFLTREAHFETESDALAVAGEIASIVVSGDVDVFEQHLQRYPDSRRARTEATWMGDALDAAQLCCLCDQVACLKVLIELGGALDGSTDRTFTRALHLSARSNAANCMRLLLGATVHVNAADSLGCTALMHAADCGSEECVRLLLDARAASYVANEDGHTALHLAANANKTECVRALLASGAKVEAENEAGSTALVSALQAGATACVEVLLAAGASSKGLQTSSPAPARQNLLHKHLSVQRRAFAEVLRCGFVALRGEAGSEASTESASSSASSWLNQSWQSPWDRYATVAKHMGRTVITIATLRKVWTLMPTLNVSFATFHATAGDEHYDHDPSMNVSEWLARCMCSIPFHDPSDPLSGRRFDSPNVEAIRAEYVNAWDEFWGSESLRHASLKGGGGTQFAEWPRDPMHGIMRAFASVAEGTAFGDAARAFQRDFMEWIKLVPAQKHMLARFSGPHRGKDASQKLEDAIPRAKAVGLFQFMQAWSNVGEYFGVCFEIREANAAIRNYFDWDGLQRIHPTHARARLPLPAWTWREGNTEPQGWTSVNKRGYHRIGAPWAMSCGATGHSLIEYLATIETGLDACKVQRRFMVDFQDSVVFVNIPARGKEKGKTREIFQDGLGSRDSAQGFQINSAWATEISFRSVTVKGSSTVVDADHPTSRQLLIYNDDEREMNELVAQLQSYIQTSTPRESAKAVDATGAIVQDTPGLALRDIMSVVGLRSGVQNRALGGAIALRNRVAKLGKARHNALSEEEQARRRTHITIAVLGGTETGKSTFCQKIVGNGEATRPKLGAGFMDARGVVVGDAKEVGVEAQRLRISQAELEVEKYFVSKEVHVPQEWLDESPLQSSSPRRGVAWSGRHTGGHMDVCVGVHVLDVNVRTKGGLLAFIESSKDDAANRPDAYVILATMRDPSTLRYAKWLYEIVRDLAIAPIDADLAPHAVLLVNKVDTAVEGLVDMSFMGIAAGVAASMGPRDFVCYGSLRENRVKWENCNDVPQPHDDAVYMHNLLHDEEIPMRSVTDIVDRVVSQVLHSQIWLKSLAFSRVGEFGPGSPQRANSHKRVGGRRGASRQNAAAAKLQNWWRRRGKKSQWDIFFAKILRGKKTASRARPASAEGWKNRVECVGCKSGDRMCGGSCPLM